MQFLSRFLFLLTLVLGLPGALLAQQTITITNQGFEYTPDTVTVQYTDSVRFNLG